MANEFIIKNGFRSQGNSEISGSLTISGSIVGTITTASYAVNGITNGSQYLIPVYNTETGLTGSLFFQSGSFTSLRGGSTPEDPSNPDILYINGNGVDTYNLLSAHGNLNDYVQINIQNYNTGVSSSSDIVATADNGTEDVNYVNMGINSENHGLINGIGAANDAYFYSTGNDLYIGNRTANKKVIIFSGADGSALDNARVYIDDNGSVGINSSDITPGNPEALLVESLSATTINLITARANVDNYVQFKILNQNSGPYASADIVAQNDLGTETDYYVDMGMNSSQHVVDTAFTVGGPNDTYLLSVGRNHYMGSPKTGSLIFFTGDDFDGDLHAKLSLHANNSHAMTGSLSITGAVTASLYGTASQAVSSSYSISSSYSMVSQTVLNTVDSSSYATSASYANVAQTLLGSVVSASYAATASYSTTSSYTISSSLAESSSYTVSSSYSVTSSYANVAQTLLGSVVSASYAATASVLLGSVVSASYAATASTTISSSYSTTSSYTLNAPNPFPYAGNAVITGSIYVSGSTTYAIEAGGDIKSFDRYYMGDTTKYFSGATGQPLYIRTINNSISFNNGAGSSTVMGRFQTNTGNFTLQGGPVVSDNGYKFQIHQTGSNAAISGAMWVSGSSVFSGSVNITAGSLIVDSSITGSLFGTASYALAATAAPAGNTGEVQYNNGGTTAGATNVEINGGNLQLVSTTDPLAPTAGNLILYSKDIAGRQMPKWIGPSGVDTPIQPNIMFNNVSVIGPGGGTTVGVIGCTVTSVGTISNPNITTTNLKTQTRRIVNTSAAAAGSLASTRVASLECWRGNTAGQGGFFIVARFGLTTTQTGMRMFVGLTDTATTAPTNIDPTTSTTPGKIGMAINASTGNWNLVHNITGTAPTVIALGGSYPVDTTSLYEMVLFAKPNDTVITYRITNLSSGAQTSGTLSTNLPATTTPLGRVCWATNNATAVAVAWDLSRFSLETDY